MRHIHTEPDGTGRYGMSAKWCSEMPGMSVGGNLSGKTTRYLAAVSGAGEEKKPEGRGKNRISIAVRRTDRSKKTKRKGIIIRNVGVSQCTRNITGAAGSGCCREMGYVAGTAENEFSLYAYLFPCGMENDGLLYDLPPHVPGIPLGDHGRTGKRYCDSVGIPGVSGESRGSMVLGLLFQYFGNIGEIDK